MCPSADEWLSAPISGSKCSNKWLQTIPRADEGIKFLEHLELESEAEPERIELL